MNLRILNRISRICGIPCVINEGGWVAAVGWFSAINEGGWMYSNQPMLENKEVLNGKKEVKKKYQGE